MWGFRTVGAAIFAAAAAPSMAYAQATAGVSTVSPSTPTPIVPHNLTPWRMFAEADVLVQFVMLALIFASLLTWAICVAKSLEISDAKRRLNADLRALAETKTFASLSEMTYDPVVDMVRLATKEVDYAGSAEGAKERVSALLDRVEVGSVQKMMRGTNILATIASSGPFVGLFGTVWGIMNAFIGISQAQTTNLAVVAPGIAQALLATSLGLVAAIPAVMIYNVLARSIADYRRLVGDASTQVMVLVSRQFDKIS